MGKGAVVTCGVTFCSAGPCSRHSFARTGRGFNFSVECCGNRLGVGGIILAGKISIIYVFMGSATSTRIVQTVTSGNIGLLTLEYTNCGGISLTTATNGVGIMQMPTCSPCTITRFAITLVLSLGHGVPHTAVQAHSKGFSLRKLVKFSVRNGATKVVNANGVTGVLVRVLHKFNVGILTCSLCPSCGFTHRRRIICYALSRLCRDSSVVSLRYPLARRAGCLVGSCSVDGVGSKIVVVGAKHKRLVRAGTLVRKLGAGGIKCTNLSMCRRRRPCFCRSGSSGVVSSSALTHLLSFGGIVIASRRTFFAGRTVAGVTRAALRGIGSFTRDESLIGRMTIKEIWSPL